MKLYIYDLETNKHVATVTADNNAKCEKLAEEHYPNDYGYTYSPAFGFEDGLVENPNAEEIE